MDNNEKFHMTKKRVKEYGYPLLVSQISDGNSIYEMYARGIHVHGILCFYDYFLYDQDEYNTELGLPYSNTAETTIYRREKFHTHERLNDANIHCQSNHFYFDNILQFEAYRKMKRLSFPLIIKPSTGAASNGVRLAKDHIMVKQQINYNQGSMWMARKLICEEYIDGLEIVVNTVSLDGVHRVCEMYTSEKFVKNGHIYYDFQEYIDINVLTLEEIEKVIAYTFECLDALYLKNGPSHVELKLDSKGIVNLIELNARFAGDMPRAREVSGFDQIDLLIWSLADHDRFYNCEYPKQFSANYFLYKYVGTSNSDFYESICKNHKQTLSNAEYSKGYFSMNYKTDGTLTMFINNTSSQLTIMEKTFEQIKALCTFKCFGRGLDDWNDRVSSIRTARQGTNLHNLIGTIVLEGDRALCKIEMEYIKQLIYQGTEDDYSDDEESTSAKCANN